MNEYIGPEHQLKSYVPPQGSQTEVIRLVHELKHAAERFKHTRLKHDLMSVINIAKEMETHGYVILWDMRRGVVGARRMDVPAALPITAKEVRRAITH